jgi:hypothetical protein
MKPSLLVCVHSCAGEREGEWVGERVGEWVGLIL